MNRKFDMWLLFFAVSITLLALGLLYLAIKISKLLPIKRKALSIFIGFMIAIVIALLLSFAINFVNMIVVMVHFIIILLVFSLIGRLIFTIRRTQIKEKFVLVGAVVLSLIYLSAGYISAHNVERTNYAVKTDKVNSHLRIVMFADSHIGTTFSGVEFEKYVEKMNKEKPDAVVICGDLIDDSTSSEDFKDALSALSKLETKYGVFYSYGNHDRGYNRSNKNNLSPNEFETALNESGITVLQDVGKPLNDDYYIIGREDKNKERKSAEELINEADINKYIIMSDHQPSDYENEAKSGIDLVLSGHTHGGQMFPLQIFTNLANDNTYGMKALGKTSFIVTSGISDWMVDFRMGTKAEYVVIDIN